MIFAEAFGSCHVHLLQFNLIANTFYDLRMALSRRTNETERHKSITILTPFAL